MTAGTLEELAEAMGADPDLLRQAVESYNAAAPEGERLETGDYAAEWRTPVLAETPGGIRTNERGAVLREDGSVLPGLYAVGAAAAGVEDDGTELWSAAERTMLLPGRAVRTALGLRTSRRSRRRQTEPRPIPEQNPEVSEPSGTYQPLASKNEY